MPKIDWPGSQDFQQTLDMGVFILSMRSPDCKDIKIAMDEVFFRSTYLIHLLFFGVFGAWMIFKKAEMK